MAAYSGILRTSKFSGIYALIPRFYATGIDKRRKSETRDAELSINRNARGDIITKRNEIKIPNRIPRGPTDILEALDSTLKKDYTASHYKYHDDPYLTPLSHLDKRSFSLSKESGRRTARWVLDNFSDLITENPAEPSIQAFLPSPQKYNENSIVDVAVLRDLIQERKVTEALAVYKGFVKRKEDLPQDLLQELLELSCFYNCNDPPNEEYVEELWFSQNVQGGRQLQKTWRSKGLAKDIFEDMKVKDEKAYSALIMGMAKYLEVDKAYGLFEEMKQQNLPLNVGVYNALLQVSPLLKEGSDTRWQFIVELLQSMNDNNVRPNVGTLNAILDALCSLGNWQLAKKYSLDIIAEMKCFDIEPCLASYYYILTIFCRERGPKSRILYDIMSRIEGKDLVMRDPKDSLFFVAAMGTCCNHLVDKELAYRVLKCLERGDNSILIGDAYKESIFYRYFFSLLAQTEDLDKLFEYYNRLVPNVYTPETNVLQNILSAIDFHKAPEYIPQLWTDMVAFDHILRGNVAEYLLQVLAETSTEKDELKRQFVAIALKVREYINGQREQKLRSVKQWTAEMLGNIVQICLKGNDFANAVEVFGQFVQENRDLVGCLQPSVVDLFVRAAVENNQPSKAFACLKYGHKEGYNAEVTVLAELMLNRLGTSLSEEQKSDLYVMRGSVTKEKVETPEN